MDPQALLDSLPDGVVVADAAGTVTAVNATARRLLGATAETGRPLREVMALQDTESQDWWSGNRPYDGIGSRVGLTEQSWLTPDGTEVLVTGRITRERRHGPVSLVSLVIRSGRGRARLDRDRSDLVATVAHELRSPLTGVKGFVSTLLTKWDRLNDDQKRLMLTTVHADSERLSRLIAELLDVARIDTGRLPLYPRETDPRPIVDRCLASAREATSRPVVAAYAEGLPPVFADPDKLAQVVTNLVDNAVRHGEGTVTVTLEPLERPYRGVRLLVDDEGEGIDEAIRARVFTKFWKHGVRGGTGLGMYLVGGLVRVHGGEVRIGESPAGGARLDVHWPSEDRR
ncbi:PAS domain-containing protein [Nocardioides scoriae]|uniref:histidine kinase n=1 Tax=Nocardioides scoriae TaxID=642780 RepID=A0A1H1PMV5_9ACTN|nr:ATP-binding protein [Nocardioides scoriae]SDS12425.1 PAS domain-containing protein [Nocardioides scoriae]